MNEQILLNKNRSKVSTNVNNSLAIQFSGSKRILPCESLETVVNEIDLYNKERQNSNLIRLTVQVNPICSNVLFNNITEIVRNEGTPNVQCLNFTKLENINENIEEDKWDKEKLLFKNDTDFTSGSSGSTITDCIRDTQLNNDSNGFKYHCGIDIFNNHLLRSKTFKTICPIEGERKEYTFNTISDFMRTYEGKEIKGFRDRDDGDEKPNLPLHLYLNEEIRTYKETVSEKLHEQNGWFGFTNVGKIKVYDDEKGTDYDWFKVINNRKPCDFIDMYPERDLFYFDPKYNSYKRRIEKNWNYCITYPSSSTTEGICFINKHTKGLNFMYFDDTIKNKNGLDAIKFWSVSKHGLKKSDIINVYKTIEGKSERIITNGKVIEIVDDYTFYVYRDGIKISNKWVLIEKEDKDKKTVDGVTYTISTDRKKFINGDKIYYIIDNEKVNIDNDSQDISFKKVVEGSELSYYVRIFSKLPNWKFRKQKPTEYLLEKYKNFTKDYQTVDTEFENHIGKLAFGKNIYNDNISEIVFTDDIDISLLRDNLNRPLSEIYFTIFKNNEGYREWYDDDDIKKMKYDTIEYSHCFGKLNCAFKLSKESIPNKSYNNVLLLNNIDSTYDRLGLNMDIININTTSNRLFDRDSSILNYDEIQYNKLYEYNTDGTIKEIKYNGDINFYGDLCCYSDVLCDEYVIQNIDYRFNTAQRETKNENFTSIWHDEIISDDYDDDGYKPKVYEITNASNRKEGYYYNPHYKIQLKTYDVNLTTVYPRFLKIKKMNGLNEGYQITTMENHLLGENSIVNLYIKKPIYDENHKLLSNDVKFYYGKVVGIVIGNSKTFLVKFYSDELMENESFVDVNDKKYMKLFIKGENIPNYAELMKDGSCRYAYRELHQNGYDDNGNVEVYPFTNGCFYINKPIILYLRRQNPTNEFDIRSKTYPYDIVTNKPSFEKENKYYNEENIEC